MRIARTRQRVARRRTCIYRGVIIADRRNEHSEDEGLLLSLGIILGRYDSSAGGYIDCAVPEAALIALDPYWGRFYWSLFPDGELEYVYM